MPDDRQPGGSGAGSTVDGIHVIARKEAWEEWAYDHDALGRSRLQSAFYAGWVACTDDLRAALEAARLERDEALEGERWAEEATATEAELRAALRILLGECCVVGRGRCENDRHIQAWGVLDAAEQPARAETAPRVRSAHASVPDDRSDLETAEGPL